MPKVIITDNFGREHIAERLYADNLSEEKAKLLAEERNKFVGEHSLDYYVVKPDDYQLYNPWE